MRFREDTLAPKIKDCSYQCRNKVVMGHKRRFRQGGGG